MKIRTIKVQIYKNIYSKKINDEILESYEIITNERLKNEMDFILESMEFEFYESTFLKVEIQLLNENDEIVKKISFEK